MTYMENEIESEIHILRYSQGFVWGSQEIRAGKTCFGKEGEPAAAKVGRGQHGKKQGKKVPWLVATTQESLSLHYSVLLTN